MLPTDRTYIVAEAGLNHNGDLDLAKRMVRSAKRVGADAVKLQTFTAEKFCATDSPFLGLFQRCELSADEIKELKAVAAEEGIDLFSTVAELSAVETVLEAGFELIKIGSANINNFPLLEAVGQTGKDVILSTGSATLGEIEQAVDALGGPHDKKIALLHCTVAYPAPPETLNLRRIGLLQDVFGADHVIGFSDHSEGPEAAMAAVALGARIVEKHFTEDNKLEGPDHAFSADPETLGRLVAGVRFVEQALGRRRPGRQEKELAPEAVRRYVVAGRDLEAGAILDGSALEFKRVGRISGRPIETRHLDLIVGARLHRAKQRDEAICWEDLLSRD